MRVCILGTGLSSLSLAKALVNQKIYVDVFMPEKTLKINKTRTIGISKSNVKFFNNNIIDIEKLIWKINKIEIFSDNYKKEKILNFEDNKEYLFSIVRNYELLNILINDLSKNTFFKKKNLINSDILSSYNLIINTDHNNPITKKYFNKKIEKKYNCFAYTTIISHEKILNNTATQIFTNKGPLAFLPISNYETSVVYSINKLNNKINNINELIYNYNFKYNIKKIKKVEFFELKSLSLRSYYHNNILSFGDLLHKVHPLAGQGFNMTIRDIIILMKIIKNKIDLGLDLDGSVNYEFQNKLKHKNFIFSNGIDMLNAFFNYERQTKNDLLIKSLKKLGKLPTINKFFTKIADNGTLL